METKHLPHRNLHISLFLINRLNPTLAHVYENCILNCSVLNDYKKHLLGSKPYTTIYVVLMKLIKVKRC